MGVGRLLDVREGIVRSVLRVGFEDGGVGGRVGFEEGGGGVDGEVLEVETGGSVGLEVGGEGREGLVVGTGGLELDGGGKLGLEVETGGLVDLEVGGEGGEGFVVGTGGLEVGEGGDGFVVGTGGSDVGGSGTLGLEVETDGSVGLEVGGKGGEGFVVGTGGFEVGGVGGISDDVGIPGGLEEDDGIGIGKEVGGIGLVVGNGGRIVELEKGGEGLNVGMLKVGKLSVGIGDLEEESDNVGLIVGIGGTGIVVLPPGGEVLDEDNVGKGTVVGATVVLKIGGEGVTAGMLNVGRLSDGRGFDVGIGGSSVVLPTGGDGIKVGRLRLGALGRLVNTGGDGFWVGEVSVGKPPVELNTGGGGNDGREVGSVSVGIGGRDVTGRVTEERAVVLKIGAVGSTVGILRLGSGSVVGSTGGIDGGNVFETLTLGIGNVNEGGRIVGIDKDGSDIVVGTGTELEFPEKEERDIIGGEGTERVGSTAEGLLEGMPKLMDAEADAEGKLTDVEGRGIPDGRLHVRFCAVAILESPNRANDAMKNMMLFIRVLQRDHNIAYTTRRPPMCNFDLLYSVPLMNIWLKPMNHIH